VFAARKYLEAGLSIIPLTYRGKYADDQALRNSGSLNIRGKPSYSRFRNKPPGDREIDIWFGSELRNIGILGTSSLTIFDFDDNKAFTIWKKKYADIANNTAIQKTNQGYHVFLKTERSISTFLSTKFTLHNTDFKKIGDVIGNGYYCTAWPSIHPNGYEYHWLKGNAPWECGILKINQYDDVGIKIIKDRVRYLRFLYLLFLKPANSINMINRKIVSFFEERTTENQELIERKGE